MPVNWCSFLRTKVLLRRTAISEMSLLRRVRSLVRARRQAGVSLNASAETAWTVLNAHDYSDGGRKSNRTPSAPRPDIRFQHLRRTTQPQEAERGEQWQKSCRGDGHVSEHARSRPED